MTLSIKSEPELRHTLAHLWYAIEAAATAVLEHSDTKAKEALYELAQVQGLIFWDEDTEDMAHSVRLWFRGQRRQKWPAKTAKAKRTVKAKGSRSRQGKGVVADA